MEPPKKDLKTVVANLNTSIQKYITQNNKKEEEYLKLTEGFQEILDQQHFTDSTPLHKKIEFLLTFQQEKIDKLKREGFSESQFDEIRELLTKNERKKPSADAIISILTERKFFFGDLSEILQANVSKFTTAIKKIRKKCASASTELVVVPSVGTQLVRAVQKTTPSVISRSKRSKSPDTTSSVILRKVRDKGHKKPKSVPLAKETVSSGEEEETASSGDENI
jgi:hypothetical protein